jgi:DNA-directed RNA polymerase II subunit RPB1
MVRYDGTVRNARGQIVQFLYGEDAMDGRWVRVVPFSPSLLQQLSRSRSLRRIFCEHGE